MYSKIIVDSISMHGGISSPTSADVDGISAGYVKIQIRDGGLYESESFSY